MLCLIFSMCQFLPLRTIVLASSVNPMPSKFYEIFGRYSEAIFEAIFGPYHKKERLDRDPPNLDTILSSATRILGVCKGGGTVTLVAARRRRRQRSSRASAGGIAAAGRRR